MQFGTKGLQMKEILCEWFLRLPEADCRWPEAPPGLTGAAGMPAKSTIIISITVAC
jgi:hypothetical protein